MKFGFPSRGRTVKVFSIVSDEVRVHGSGGRVTYRIFPNMVQTSESLESHHVWCLDVRFSIGFQDDKSPNILE